MLGLRAQKGMHGGSAAALSWAPSLPSLGAPTPQLPPDPAFSPRSGSGPHASLGKQGGLGAEGEGEWGGGTPVRREGAVGTVGSRRPSYRRPHPPQPGHRTQAWFRQAGLSRWRKVGGPETLGSRMWAPGWWGCYLLRQGHWEGTARCCVSQADEQEIQAELGSRPGEAPAEPGRGWGLGTLRWGPPMGVGPEVSSL